MKVLVLLIAAVLVALSAGCLSPSWAAPSWNDLVVKAENDLTSNDTGKRDRAPAELREALFGRGKEYLRTHNYFLAERDLSRSLELIDDNKVPSWEKDFRSLVLSTRALVYEDWGKLELASQDIDAAIAVADDEVLKASLASHRERISNKLPKARAISIISSPSISPASSSSVTADAVAESVVRLLQERSTTDNVTTANTADSADTPHKPANRPISDKWAFIVGISNFKDKNIKPLSYAAKDAMDFRNFLVKEAHFAPDHIRVLTDAKATKRRVESEVGSKFLARVAQPDDLVVLFFSTHGSPARMDERGKNFLVTHDTETDDLYATGIEMQQILSQLKDRVSSDRVLLVLDACHSGATGFGSKAIGAIGNFDAAALAQGSGQLVICSSQPEEASYESTRYPNGIFTKKLLEGLHLNGPSTKLGDAFNYVQSAVKIEAQEAYSKKQQPILRSKWNGNDLVLAAPPVAPRALPPEVKAKLEPDSTVAPAVVPCTSTARRSFK